MQTAEDAPNMQPNDVGPTSEVDGSHSNEPTSSAKSEGTHESSSYGLVSAGDASAVKRYKALVYVALAIAVVIVGTLTYNLTASDETATFEREVSVPAFLLNDPAVQHCKRACLTVRPLVPIVFE